MYEKLKARARKEEGLSLQLYKCPAGKLTIGYGHNIEDNGIPIHIAEALLDYDIKVAKGDLFKAYPHYEDLSANRQEALIDMCLNMGIGRLKGFTKMHKAIANKDFFLAGAELMDSIYGRGKTRNRAKRNQQLMEGG